MAKGCRREAWIVAIANRPRAGDRPIRLRVGVTLISPTLLEPVSAARTARTRSWKIVLKVLIISALLALLLLLLYSRIYPYIQILRKIFGSFAKTLNDSPSTTRKASQGKSVGKLVRCVGCGTWIPTERAIGSRAGGSVYCSRECIEKATASENRKAAM